MRSLLICIDKRAETIQYYLFSSKKQALREKKFLKHFYLPKDVNCKVVGW